MWDGIPVRVALIRVYLWLFSTIRCFSKYLPQNSHPQESILPVAETNPGNHRSSGGLIVQIGAGLSQVYCWLTSTVHVFLNYLNVSPVHRHNRPQVVPDHQASSHQHHINILNPISHDSNNVREASNHMNPTTLLFQSQIALGLTVPITELLLNDDKSLTIFQSTSIIIVLSLAFAATFSGMFLEGSIAIVTANLGIALVLISYYGLVSSTVPAALGWICWLCFALSCVPLVRSTRRLIFSSTSTDITQRRSPV